MIRNIVYYITGHGLGHATRSLEIINAIILSTSSNSSNFNTNSSSSSSINTNSNSNNSQYKLYIVTAIDKSFFIKSLSNDYNISIDKINEILVFDSRTLDSGAIQSDALTVNKHETLKTYHDNIHLNHTTLIEFETKWLINNKIELALIDATPLAVKASSINNIKTILLTNFTWDFIYSEMIKNDSGLEEIYSDMIKEVSQDYSYCTSYIQYPGICPIINIPSTNCIEGPLVSRTSKKTRDDMRKQYNISADKKVLLIGFGGHNFNFKNITNDSYLSESWICIVLGSNDMTNTEKFISVSYDCYVPDLLIMVDCVIGKVGYGFVSECLSAGCPLIYISRSNWSEENYLIQLLQTYNAGFEMTYNDFINGNWIECLDRALSISCSWKLNDLHSKNGPEMILKQIESLL